VETFVLEAGDILYVPHNLVVFYNTVKQNSLDLIIAIPPQPNWENILELSITAARKKTLLNF